MLWYVRYFDGTGKKPVQMLALVCMFETSELLCVQHTGDHVTPFDVVRYLQYYYKFLLYVSILTHSVCHITRLHLAVVQVIIVHDR